MASEVSRDRPCRPNIFAIFAEPPSILTGHAGFTAFESRIVSEYIWGDPRGPASREPHAGETA